MSTLADTEKLGRLLAGILVQNGNPPLLLTGEPGCGKTTLTGFICAAFPGAEEAEVSSPSFTICNLYPCRPQILHCDLYRCREQIPEEALDFMDARQGQIIMEWADYLRPLPPEYLDISFQVINNSRRLELRAEGEAAEACLRQIFSLWS